MDLNKSDKGITVQTGPVSQIVAQTQKLSLDESFEKHSQIVDQARAEYKQIYKNMVAHLSCEHLQPFAKILEEEECKLKNCDSLIESLREILLRHLEDADILGAADVATALQSLEMLKQRFKNYEGRDWKVTQKTPEERILPIRMKFKEKQLHYLQKEFDLQKLELEETFNSNKKLRGKLCELTKDRINLQETISKWTERFKEDKEVLLNLQQSALDTYK